jgi:hypothetical protein
LARPIRRGEVVHVDLAQRAVEVVRAADRASRLHPRVLLHRERGEAPQLVVVHVHERVHEHRRDLLAGEPLTATFASALAGLAVGALLALAVLGAPVAGAVALGADALAEQREVDVEHGVERAAVAVVLHERGGERLLEQRAVVELDVLDRPHRVEVLGHRHREPRRTQLVHEPLEHIKHHSCVALCAAGYLRRGRSLRCWRPPDLIPTMARGRAPCGPSGCRIGT